ncbi:MAG: glycosyltransferase family 4 protein [Spirochaetia bacterium]
MVYTLSPPSDNYATGGYKYNKRLHEFFPDNTMTSIHVKSGELDLWVQKNTDALDKVLIDSLYLFHPGQLHKLLAFTSKRKQGTYLLCHYLPSFDSGEICVDSRTKKLLPRFTGIICPSRFLSDLIHSYNKNICVAKPGIDTVFSCDSKVTRKKQVLTVANPSPVKNIEFLTDLFSTWFPIDWRWVIAGDYQSDYGKELMHRCKKGLGEERVLFYGVAGLEELAALYNESAFLCLSSKIETYGICAAEAQACCLPVIGPCAGGLREAVENNRTGKLIPLENRHSWIQTVRKCFTQPEYLEYFEKQLYRKKRNTWKMTAQIIYSFLYS